MRDEATSPRDVLLETGKRLALERGSAVWLDAKAVTHTANLPEPVFFANFSDQRGYLLSLMLHFLDLARAEAIEAIGRAPPGIPRVGAAFETYWDANLRWRPMRELAIHFRADPDGTQILRARLNGVVMIAQHELKSIGWPYPAATARLAGNMCVEAAIAEFEAGQKLPEMRGAVMAYFREPRPKVGNGNAIP